MPELFFVTKAQPKEDAPEIAPREYLLSVGGWLATCIAITLIFCYLARPDLRLWTGIVSHGLPSRPAIALTFDDGPHPLWAPLMAETLEHYGARGTFFIVATEANRYPELTARLARAGHEIANHSLNHPYPNLTSYTRARVRTEIAEANALLRKILTDETTGSSLGEVRYFRPPGGGLNDGVIEESKHHHLRIGWWSENVNDAFSPEPYLIVDRMKRITRPGSIALMHQRENSAIALERFFEKGLQAERRYETLDKVVTGR